MRSDPAPKAVLDAGSIVGPFEVVGLLGGVGGAGAVYEASDASGGRTVALKVFEPSLSHDPKFRGRFERWVERQATLDHAHAAKVQEAGTSEHGLYLAMDLIRGPSLAELLATAGPLPASRTLELLDPIADALDAAHAHGLLHHDLKPAKILIADGSGKAFLTGFGVRRPSPPVEPAAGNAGAASYASPEQVRGDPPTSRSDVYSFAAVVHEALTGEPPSRPDSERALVEGDPSRSPEHLGAPDHDLSRGLARAVARSLAKEPLERHASPRDLMREAREASERLLEPGDSHATKPAGRPRPGRRPRPSSSAPARPPAAPGTDELPVHRDDRRSALADGARARGAPAVSGAPEATAGRRSTPTVRTAPSSTGRRTLGMRTLLISAALAAAAAGGWLLAPAAEWPRSRPAIEPERDFARTFNDTIRRLNARRTKLRDRLAAAGTAAAQAEASTRLARAHVAAARSIAAAEPESAIRGLSAAVVDTLHRTADAYGRMASSARRHDQSGFAAAGRDVEHSESELRRAIGRLSAATTRAGSRR